MNKFENEINYIKNKDIQEFLINALTKIPDYFWEISASSTNKFHPFFALGSQGLYRHSRAAVLIAYNLLNLEMYQKIYNERQRDLIIVALVLHDSHKKGIVEQKHTIFEHPLVAANFVRGLTGLPQEEIEYIALGIETHMGEFCKDKRSGKELPKLATAHQKFIHMCDYLASRKFLEVNFEVDDPTLKETSTASSVPPEDFILTFGKFKGLKISEVYQKERSYLTWAKDNLYKQPDKTMIKNFCANKENEVRKKFND